MKKSSIRKILKVIVPYLCFLVLTFMVLYPQVKSRIFLAGYDSWFHMSQFYDTAMQLKSGHLSYFLSLYGFGGFGQIVNAVYGPGFVYLGGLILLLCGTWFRFELVQDFLGLLIGGSLFYILSRKNNVSRVTSTLLGTLYMMTDPVLSWAINQEFDGIEAILMPLILIQGTQMVRKRRIHPVALGVTMALIFQTHMMTTLVGSLALIPFFIYAWCRTDNVRRLFKDLILSIVLTIGLTGNVWGAMLNIIPQGLIPPVPRNDIEPGGAIIYMLPGHYFSVLGFVYTVVVGFFIVCGILSLFFWRRTTALYKLILWTGLFFIWISSIYFPWSWVYKIYPAFAYQIQFPKRFVAVGLALLFLAMGVIFGSPDVDVLGAYKGHVNYKVMLAFQALLFIFAGASFMNQRALFQRSFRIYRSKDVIDYNPFHTYRPSYRLARELRSAYHSPNSLGKGITLVHQDIPDYLPTHNVIHTYAQYRHNGCYGGVEKQLYGDVRYLHIRKVIYGDRLTMTWAQKRSKRNDTLPTIKYRDTKVTFNHHVLRKPRISRIGAVQVHRVPRGRNTLTIRYRVPIWFKVLMGITLISWVCIFIKLIKVLYCKLKTLL